LLAHRDGGILDERYTVQYSFIPKGKPVLSKVLSDRAYVIGVRAWVTTHGERIGGKSDAKSIK
jgi:hypothetical protein